MEIYTKADEVFEQIHRFKTTKNMVLLEKKNYDTISKTIEIWLNMEKTMALWKKNFGTIVNDY